MKFCTLVLAYNEILSHANLHPVLLAMVSTVMTNIKAESGQPCLMLIAICIGADGQPLLYILHVILVYRVRTHL